MTSLRVVTASGESADNVLTVAMASGRPRRRKPDGGRCGALSLVRVAGGLAPAGSSGATDQYGGVRGTGDDRGGLGGAHRHQPGFRQRPNGLLARDRTGDRRRRRHGSRPSWAVAQYPKRSVGEPTLTVFAAPAPTLHAMPGAPLVGRLLLVPSLERRRSARCPTEVATKETTNGQGDSRNHGAIAEVDLTAWRLRQPM